MSLTRSSRSGVPEGDAYAARPKNRTCCEKCSTSEKLGVSCPVPRVPMATIRPRCNGLLWRPGPWPGAAAIIYRASGVKLILCGHGKGRRDLPAEYSMRITVCYGDPARGQVRKLLRVLGLRKALTAKQWRAENPA